MRPSDPPQPLRFRSVGSPLRARLARPLLMGGTAVAAITARLGSSASLHRVERFWGRMVERYLALTIDVEGLDRVNPRGQYVVVALHEGLADPVALLRLPLQLKYLVRDELFEWPGLGRYLAFARHVYLDRLPTRATLRRLFEETERLVAEGESLVVFAQGSVLGIEIAFEPGAVRLASHLRLSLLPVVLSGSHRVWEHPYSSTVRFGQRIFMKILAPIPHHSISTDSLRSLEREMKRIALEEATAPPRRFVPERDGWWDDYHYRIDPDFPDLAERVAAHRLSLRSDPRG